MFSVEFFIFFIYLFIYLFLFIFFFFFGGGALLMLSRTCLAFPGKFNLSPIIFFPEDYKYQQKKKTVAIVVRLPRLHPIIK